MTTKQKYYVLENGEYVVKYRDHRASQVLKSKISPDRTFKPDNDKLMTPKSSRNNISGKLDCHPFANKRLFTSRRLMDTENAESDTMSYLQCMT